MPAVALAGQASCPAEQAHSPLITVTLYDGPPSEHADLAPDSSQEDAQSSMSVWSVDYIFSAGRRLFVTCEYAAGAPLQLEPPPSVKKCVFLKHGSTDKSLACE